MSSTPICRCRVLYLGSAVPQASKEGLHGIQEPLRDLYPEEGVLGANGIDSWLSVWSNGLLLENVDEKRMPITRFFPIDSLHYCAAVRHVSVPSAQADNNAAVVHQRFLPLDSPFARIPSAHDPPLFACILRRTTGIKVLECHAFVCKKEMAANALVRCCFHAYADNAYAKQLENGDINTLNPIHKVEQWQALSGQTTPYQDRKIWPNDSDNRSDTRNEEEETDAEQQSLYSDLVNNTLPTQKSNRPRQLMSPSSPPPPPPTQFLNENENNKKNKKFPKSKSPNNLQRWRSAEFRPMMASPCFMPSPYSSPTPLMMMSPHLPPAGIMKNGGLRTKNGGEDQMYVPINGHPFKYGGNQLYHPSGFPYAAEDPGYYMLNSSPNASRTPTPTKYHKKKEKSNSNPETKYSTGIYRKKGHLNERAFSYSIRQEHRSRSHSSLATLSFNNESTTQNGEEKGEKAPHTNGTKVNNNNGSKNDSGLSSDSSVGRHPTVIHSNSKNKMVAKKKSEVKKNGHGSEINIKNLHLADNNDDDDDTEFEMRHPAVKNNKSNNKQHQMVNGKR